MDKSECTELLRVGFELRHTSFFRDGQYRCPFCLATLRRTRGVSELHLVHADTCSFVRYYHALYTLGIITFAPTFNTESDPERRKPGQ
jgi:hypothetical protein